MGDWPIKGRFTDAGLAGLILLIVGMMVVPLPAAVLDVLISGNIALSLLMLLSAVYAKQALSFAAMPSALLVATLYRLALNVSSTRLILLQADAGEVISAFGQFVVRGDYIVGAVVFTILTIIQFVVIARGAERVAEVGARFSLDAMPGKQLAIDADLRSGAIGAEQGRMQRRALARESQFYGAMDGAMKFVKGDAIASVLIVGIDLVAGLVVGMVTRDLSLLDSLRIYGLLTIGDGLSSQLPSLLISTSAGIVITRVAGEDSGTSLAQELKAQLFGSREALRLAAAFLAALGLVPGLPPIPLLAVAAACFGLSLRAKATGERDTALEFAPRPGTEALAVGLHPAVPFAVLDGLRQQAGEFQVEIFSRCGLSLHAPRLFEDPGAPSSGYRVLVHEIPTAGAKLPAQGTIAEQVQMVRQGVLSAVDAHGAALLNLQQTQSLLDALERIEPARVRHVVPNLIGVHEVADLLRRLLDEGVSIRPLGEILEACGELRGAAPGAPLHTLYERLRERLGRRICHQIALDAPLTLLTLDPLVEGTLSDHVLTGDTEPRLSLPPDLAQDLCAAVARAASAQDGPTALVAQARLRPLLRGLLRKEPNAPPVLSYRELSPDFSVKHGPVICP